MYYQPSLKNTTRYLKIDTIHIIILTRAKYFLRNIAKGTHIE